VLRPVSGFSLTELPRSVLVVEDDEGIRDSVRRLLEDEGFAVTTANTLAGARDLLFGSTLPIGVVVLDLGLPDGDGELLLRSLDRLGSATPAVVVTSGSAGRAVPLGREFAVPVITKPFDVSVLAATVSVAFAHALRPHRREHPSGTMRLGRT
jgi:DNA-binding response OmpR family regulator